MSKRLCFLYTETTGLHHTTESVSKKKLYAFARMVTINYEIGIFKDGNFIVEQKVRTICKPRCMNIPEDTIGYHGITQEKAIKKGIDPEIVINKFKDDIKNVDIIVSHNIDFHLKTVQAEAVRYNILLNFNKFVIVDTISFYHQNGFMKLKDLAEKLHIKEIPTKSKDYVELIRDVFFKLYSKFEKSVNKSINV